MLTLNYRDSRPIYGQIKDGLRRMIVSGILEPDEKLPLFFAYKAGVLLEGGNMFVQNSDGFIRLNLACPKATVEEGLKRICEAVNTKHTEKYLGEK